MNEPAIEIRGVAKSYGKKPVLTGLDLDVPKGSVVGLLYIWITGKDASTYELPFGSFLGIAGLGVGFVVGVIGTSHWVL